MEAILAKRILKEKNLENISDVLLNLVPLKEAFPTLLKLIQTAMTICVSTAHCERSFSTLKRITLAGSGDTSLILFVHNEVFGTGINAVAVSQEVEPTQTGEAGLTSAAGLAVLNTLETVRRLKIKVLSSVAGLRTLAVDGCGVVQGARGAHVVTSACLAV